MKMIANMGTKESSIFTHDESVREIGNMYFGIYTLVISCELSTMEVKPIEVASVKKLKNTTPIIRYAGKFAISCLKIVEKIIYWTSIVKSGFRKLHRIPSTDRLYLVLKSRDTS